MAKLLTKTERRFRVCVGKRKKYIEEKMVPQMWLFSKITKGMLFVEKVLRSKKVNYG